MKTLAASFLLAFATMSLVACINVEPHVAPPTTAAPNAKPVAAPQDDDHPIDPPLYMARAPGPQGPPRLDHAMTLGANDPTPPQDTIDSN